MNPLDTLVKFVNDGLCVSHRARIVNVQAGFMHAPEIVTISHATRQLVTRAYQIEDGNIAKAAALIGMGRTTYYRYLRRYGLIKHHA